MVQTTASYPSSNQQLPGTRLHAVLDEKGRQQSLNQAPSGEYKLRAVISTKGSSERVETTARTQEQVLMASLAGVSCTAHQLRRRLPEYLQT